MSNRIRNVSSEKDGALQHQWPQQVQTHRADWLAEALSAQLHFRIPSALLLAQLVQGGAGECSSVLKHQGALH